MVNKSLNKANQPTNGFIIRLIYGPTLGKPWRYPPPTNSEIIICSFLWRAPYKPSLSTVSGPGIPPRETHNKALLTNGGNVAPGGPPLNLPGLDSWMHLQFQWLHDGETFGSPWDSGWMVILFNWAALSDEQMSNRWPFSLLNDEQMSNKVGVEHQPVKLGGGNMIKFQ